MLITSIICITLHNVATTLIRDLSYVFKARIKDVLAIVFCNLFAFFDFISQFWKLYKYHLIIL